MARRFLVRSLVLALAIAAPVPALAQPAKHAQAEEQFHKAREAQNKGDFRRALELLQASQASEPGRGKLVNIAICEAELGMVAAALRHFEEVRPQLPTGDDRLPIVDKRLDQLRGRVPVLRIEAGRADARVKIDDEAVPAEKLGGEIRVEPGKHTVTVAAEGRPEARREVELKEGEHRTLRFDGGGDEGKGAPAETAAPEEPPASSGRRTAGLALVGVGAAGVVIGIGTGIASIVDHGSATNGCPTHVGCPQSVLDKASQGKALAGASTAAFVLGAAAAGVGVFLVVTGSPGKPKAATGLVLLPGGARVEGRF